jgi:hypothetical protein
LTQTLRTFEQGVLPAGLVLGMAAAIGGFATLAGIWLHPGVSLRAKLLDRPCVWRRLPSYSHWPRPRLGLPSTSRRISATHSHQRTSAPCRTFAGGSTLPYTWPPRTLATRTCGAASSPSSNARCRT